ncbi:MAG: winged helix DNA-binding domain-containing protein [Prevotella sp.]|nr:winged helix DNA-binding domain-containing protein [Prevotella sp.]MCI1324511.1 winged helix DNA-binding domain-containing protein [Prevotella sp.]MCI1349222.1 winged helix DNA-binding domain-containing protein [Prevotella sp.]MCI1415350.1 winged helix DNA-binding domain-containing protein [Prevotella sp.]
MKDVVHKDSAQLLPPYDEYLIGYKSRDLVLPPGQRHRTHNNSGNFYPVIAHNGIIYGNWSPYEDMLQVDFFDKDTLIDYKYIIYRKALKTNTLRYLVIVII